MRAGAALAATLLLLNCREAPAPAEKPPSATREVDEERDNLLNAGYGAAVVSRTGELSLKDSAIRAIDGDPTSAWSAPPNDQRQTLVFSLPAPVRIEKLGLRTPAASDVRTSAVSFEVSSDGESFEKVVEAKLPESDDPQMFDTPIPSAQYVRVNVLAGGVPFATLPSLLLHGRWLGPRAIAPISGCWTINGFPARFVESGGRIEGIIEEDEPLLLSGGAHEAAYLLAWTKMPQWGEGLVTLAPNGERLSGLRWHEEPARHSDGNGWFGVRRACAAGDVDADRVWQRFLAAAGWYPLFSLHFDESNALVEEQSRAALEIIAQVLARVPAQRIRLVAREFRGATAAENRARAEARLQSLRVALTGRGADVARIDFAAAGSDSPRRPVPSAALRLLYSVVELQIAETARSAF